jgi:hypothetical protein
MVLGVVVGKMGNSGVDRSVWSNWQGVEGALGVEKGQGHQEAE